MPAYYDLARGETSGVSFKIPEGIHRAAFSTADWNAIKRDALMAGGWRFIHQHLYKRFTDFARNYLGYRARIDGNVKRNMMGRKYPLVETGKFRDALLAGAYPQAAAAGKELWIRTPFIHPLRPEHAAVLQRITDAELADLNRVISEQVQADVMEAGRRGKIGGTAVKLGLTPVQKSSIKLGLKDRGGARYRLLAERQRAA